MSNKHQLANSQAHSAKPENEPEEMLPEYKFDYKKARPNRFAGKVSCERVVVMLDADVSQVSTTPEAVNTVLRALVAALPPGLKPEARGK